MSTFNLGTLAVEVDPANGKETLSPSAAKAVIRKHVGQVVNIAGKAVDAKLDTPNGEVSVNKATRLFLKWQSVDHHDAVQAYKTGILDVAGELANGNFHLDITANVGTGVIVIRGEYTGDLTTRTANLETIKALVARLNG